MRSRDSDFSKKIRDRDRHLCRYRLDGCRVTATEVSHVFTRKCHAIRWDMRNGLASCRSCHLKIEADSGYAKKVHALLLGSAFQELELLFERHYYGL